MNKFERFMNQEERLKLIQFVLCYGTHLCCRTNRVTKELNLEDIEKAFLERERKISENIFVYQNELKNYSETKKFSSNFRHLNQTPFEEVEVYFKELIDLEKQQNCRKNYHVSVDYLNLEEKHFTFHQMLNPKISFGYSNVLHEECFCEIIDFIQKELLGLFSKDFMIENLSYGAFYYEGKIYYEDLEIYKDNRILLSTVSHEMMFEIYFNKEDYDAFQRYLDKN